MPPESPPEAVRLANARRADEVVAALAARGVRLAFVAPGSRSTPLVLALVRAGLRAHVVLDERSAAFQALGAARTGTLATVVTTSGTAVANLLPACAEAARDHVAFICCTADRALPDVARGASQTLPQPPLLAGAVRHVLDLPAPNGVDDAPIGASLAAALDHLFGPDAGPVHLNVRFDKPLEPPPGYAAAATLPDTPPPGGTTQDGLARDGATGAISLPAEPGVVVVGALPWAARAGVAAFLARLGWPTIVDVTSGVSPPEGVARLPTLALRSASARAALRPRSVLWIGGLTTEDAVPAWLAERRAGGGCPVTLLSVTASHRDPFGLADEVVHVDPARLPDLAPEPRRVDDRLAALVRTIAREVDRLRTSLDEETDASEPAIARAVVGSVRAGDVLLLGNSMPVRDADRFGQPAPGVALVVNRGAAGIDGCVATAVGACLATGRATTALLGDLAVLHDLSSLAGLAGPELADLPLRVVVVNNAGGGIFSFLPVGDRVDARTMRRFFETPHPVRLAAVAASLGIEATTVHGLQALRQRLGAPPERPEVVEVVTDRHDNVRVHRALDERLDAAIARALGGPA